MRATAPEEYDYLRKVGVKQEGILRLTQGRVSLKRLVDSTSRSAHVPGVRAPFFASGRQGEEFLEKQYEGAATQQVFAIVGCEEVCNRTARRFDVVVNGVAHESKVGRVYLTPGIKRQMESDAYCVMLKACTGVMWHFYPSAQTNTLGASVPVLEELERLGIPYTIHLPR